LSSGAGLYLQDGLGFLSLILGGAAYNRGRRLAAQSAQHAIEADPRSPILFLRSFTDDDLKVRSRRLVSRNPLLLLAAWAGFGRKNRFEEAIVAELSARGPVVAIGQPSERLPQLGAARWYEADSSWQDAIASMMRRASVIVIAAARTDGVTWEIHQVEDLEIAGCVVWLMPPVDNDEVQPRWQHVAQSMRSPELRRVFDSMDLKKTRAVLIEGPDRAVAVSASKWGQVEYQLALKVMLAAIAAGDRARAHA
jgi:hypothetical protein